MTTDTKLVILDGEFGGIGMQYSLLSMYFMITDSNFNQLDELSLFVKPNDGIYRVCGEAMEINKINLVEHDKIAVDYKKAGTLLYEFLKKNSDNGKIKLIPVGHGFSGDLDQIFDKLMSRPTWETFVSYRRLDTSVALQFLKLARLFPENVSGSLASLIEYFNIKIDNIHTAKDDTIAIKECLKKLIETTYMWDSE